ncbi:hypothetical protein C8J56DRAFT_846401 [Mycena floridula]|nr:hypothetical protein C8J56DRAFT_846401 [Mycena floridula]
MQSQSSETDRPPVPGPGTSVWNPYSFLPKVEGEPWGNCMQAINKHDEDMCSGLQSDIDTTLVFAGLFSAAVTPFTIESYKWLSEDPNQISIRLISQLSGHLGTPNLPELAPFAVSLSSVRINICWFLSLVVALATALIGIIAKQWLREYQHDAAISSKQAFKLRQLRHQSWEKWHVPSIVSSLSILLEIALVLFFTGVVDLLWTLNRPVALCITVTVAGAVLFLIITTILPSFYVLLYLVPQYSSFSIVRELFPDVDWHDRHPCPYKSPQSLAALQLSLPVFSCIFRVVEWSAMSRIHISWTSFDLWILEDSDLKIMRGVKQKGPARLVHTYLVRGVSWMIQTFGNSATHVKDILHCIQPPYKDDPHNQVVPLIPYATDNVNHSPDEALVSFLDSLPRDDALEVLYVEALLRCIERSGPENTTARYQGVIRLHWWHKEGLLGINQLPEPLVINIIHLARKYFQSVKLLPHSTINTWIVLTSSMWLHPRVDIRQAAGMLIHDLEGYMTQHPQIIVMLSSWVLSWARDLVAQNSTLVSTDPFRDMVNSVERICTPSSHYRFRNPSPWNVLPQHFWELKRDVIRSAGLNHHHFGLNDSHFGRDEICEADISLTVVSGIDEEEEMKLDLEHSEHRRRFRSHGLVETTVE